MSINKIEIRSKPFAAPKRENFNVYLVAAAIAVFAAALGVAEFAGKLNFSGAPPENFSRTNSVIRVPAGGDLQAAVNRARGGDVIELEAGATYKGGIILPVKQTADFITIQSSAVSKLPADARVSPAQANSMAKIVSPGRGAAAVSAENGAHHFRFVGIEFAPGGTGDETVYNLILFGAGEKKPADVPRDLEIDRCYVHSLETVRTRRGVALNSAETVIKNSYFEGFAFPQEETQAICGWTGTKNVKIINNYIEAGAENILFGGADPFSAELIPSDIEVRGNFLFKPYEWLDKVTLKTLFELKNARRVLFTGNFLENSPTGSAFRITVRNQDGTAAFSTIEDVIIKDNIVTTAAQGVNILGTDDTYPSQMLKRLQIVNNIFYKIDGDNAYFVQIAGGEDVLIANNTVFQTGNITTFYGAMPKNFLFRDNIVGHGDYGIHGRADIKSTAGEKLFQNNVIVNNKNVTSADISFPPNNFFVNSYSDVGFVNPGAKNFRLAAGSRFKGKGANKTDIGANVESVVAAVPKELFTRLRR